MAMTFCAGGEERAGEAARAWADLDDGDASQRTGGAGDAPGQVQIEQEVLPERFLGGEAKRRDHLAQRRQSVGRETHAAARRAARRSAAIKLDGLARPVPAMSKAVP